MPVVGLWARGGAACGRSWHRRGGGIGNGTRPRGLAASDRPPTARLQSHSCNGTIVEDEDMGPVLQFQGDQRDAIATFLIENGTAPRSRTAATPRAACDVDGVGIAIRCCCHLLLLPPLLPLLLPLLPACVWQMIRVVRGPLVAYPRPLRRPARRARREIVRQEARYRLSAPYVARALRPRPHLAPSVSRALRPSIVGSRARGQECRADGFGRSGEQSAPAHSSLCAPHWIGG